MYLDLTLSEFCSLFFGDVAVVLIHLLSQREFVNRAFLGDCVGLTLHALHRRKSWGKKPNQNAGVSSMMLFLSESLRI